MCAYRSFVTQIGEEILIPILKGREATLNRAIIETLVSNPSLIVSELHREVKKIPYVQERIKELEKFKVVPSTVSRRIEALQSAGWVKVSGERPVSLFKGAITSEYALTCRGIISALAMSTSTQSDVVMVLEVNTKYNPILQELHPLTELLAFYKEILPNPLFEKYCVIPLRDQLAKINWANLSDRELLVSFREIFLYTSSSFMASEKMLRDFKKHFGRRFKKFKKKLDANLWRFKPITPYLKAVVKEHEKQAEMLRSVLELIPKD